MTDVASNDGAAGTGADEGSAGAQASAAGGSSGGAARICPRYADLVVGDAPSAYYRLDDPASSLMDASGALMNGAYGAPRRAAPGLLVSDSDAAALAASGALGSSLATVQAAPRLRPSSAITLEAWVAPGAEALAGLVPVVSYGDAGVAPYDSYKFEITAPDDANTAPHVSFQIAVGGQFHKLESHAAVTVGATLHLVGTYDGATQSLYVNGVLDGSAPVSGPLDNYPDGKGLTLGGDSTGQSRPFAGTLDEVAIYSTALAAERVAYHFAVGSAAVGTGCDAPAGGAGGSFNDAGGAAGAGATSVGGVPGGAAGGRAGAGIGGMAGAGIGGASSQGGSAGNHDTGPNPDQGGTTAGDEYVWIDQDITWDAAMGGLNVAHPPPENWYSPVDYADGQIQVRLDVSAKADDRPVWLELCIWDDALGSDNHTCLHCIDPAQFTSKGLYTCTTQAGGPVDYHKPVAAMQHRVKDGSDPNNRRGQDLYNVAPQSLPIAAHYTVVLVPQGKTFSGWDSYPYNHP